MDSPPYNDENFDVLITESTYICVPTKLAELDFVSMQTTLSRIEELGAKEKTIIIPNMLIYNANYTEYFDIIDEMGFKRVENNLFAYKGISELFISNTPLTSRAKLSVENTINEIFEKLKLN